MSEDFHSKILEMMDHIDKNGARLTHNVDGEEVEAATADEQLAIFTMMKEKEKEDAFEKAAAEQRKKDLEAIEAENKKRAAALQKQEKETGIKRANLWGGRFTKPTDKKVFDFNASINFDKRLLPQDILGSMAHAGMLYKIGVLTKEESDSIIHALGNIRDEVESGLLEISDEHEDIHSFIEAELTSRLGDTGKKVHTGRSRNDQVALDMRMYIRGEILAVDSLLKGLLEELIDLMEAHLDTVMPGFTHLQKAQPTTLAHHLGAYFEMFKRDRSRMRDTFTRMNYSPLGSCAFAGTTYPLDRAYTAELLGFYGPCLNSMDGVSDRDYLIDFLAALAEIMMHLSRFSEEVIIWNTDEYRFVDMDDAYSTGSSIMPQKKNPDIAELIRGKTGRVYGALTSILTTMKGLPLAYNKDMQEDKEMAFDAIDTVKNCIELFTEMIATTRFNKERMELSAARGFTNATDAADYLVGKGMPFRDAHSVIGRIVVYCSEKSKSIDEMSIDELKDFSDIFDEDVYDAISVSTCVNKRLTVGAPGKEAMIDVITQNRAYLAMDWQDDAGVGG